MGKRIKVRGLIVTIILRTSLLAKLTICLATQLADITPTGFKLLLNGPKISFLTTQGASKRLMVTSSPMALLLNSYKGLKAGFTSASEVFTQTSFLMVSRSLLMVSKKVDINRKVEKVLTS